MADTVTPQETRDLLHADGEAALLDLRDAGPFSMGHPLFAIPLPFDELTRRVGSLVPRTSAPILLIDDDGAAGGRAERAAGALETMGYSDTRIVEGGIGGWDAAGYTLYEGVNVPSKTLGELAELIWHPKMLKAEELATWQDEGHDFHFYDCRPPSEYAKMRVPGATCLPNGEIAHRLSAIPDDKPLVLTCAGRTRGLIGAISLSRICAREIYALENGTQGWALEGYALQRGNTADPYPELDEAARNETRTLAEDFLADEKIPVINADTVASLLAEEDRTTYLIDVRSAEEAASDPLPGFAHALSGQLVQSTDQWIGVRKARVVLADDLGLRAGLAAWWLRMLGYEPYVTLLNDDLRDLTPPEMPQANDGADNAPASKPAAPTQGQLAPDIPWFAHGRHDGDHDASRLYLSWEQGLVAQLDPEERAQFHL
ncbi:MAG: rhodanese [Litoreibacter sp.]|nr:rhodanese [Litoreibacter sp.]